MVSESQRVRRMHINIVTVIKKKNSFQQDSAHFKESHYSVRYRAHEWRSVVSAVQKDGSLQSRLYTFPSDDLLQK